MRLPALPALLLTALALPSCSRNGPASWERVEEASLDEAGRGRLERAVGAREQLFQRLSGALMQAVQEGGPASAIGVCSDLAPRLAREVGEEAGLSIGRTSFKLRNPANRPPEWASPHVEARAEERVLLQGPAAALAVLDPIRIVGPCLVCHGPAEDLDPAVRTALAERYPDDRATGFASGDLRGWFWVEVP